MKIDLQVHATDKLKSYILARGTLRMTAICGLRVRRTNVVSLSGLDAGSITCVGCRAILAERAKDAALCS